MSYLAVKYIHILSATVLFGTGLGTFFYMLVANRSRNVQAMAVVARHVVLADFIFTTPAGIIQPLSGLYLAHLTGMPVSFGWSPAEWNWLGATFALYFISGASWLPVVWLQMRMHRMAEAAARTGNVVPEVYWSHARYWTALAAPGFGALAVVYWLMVAKPF